LSLYSAQITIIGFLYKSFAVSRWVIYNAANCLETMQTIYRKYRPQNFKEVFGQESIVKVLQKQIKDGKIGHAYLFTGPRGTGKTSIARLVAKAVNCEKAKGGNPCRKCSSCKSIEQGKFLDLIEIDAASNRGIEEIRRLRERVNFSPSEGKYKVYIIDEVHMLTKDAFNALLKTLEEPPVHVIFILATTEPRKILPTIISRCQRFNFTLASDEIVLKKLKYICQKEGVDFSDEALQAIVSNAGGSFRDSESILEKVLGGIGVKNDKRVDFADVKDILGLVEDKEVKSFVEKLLNKDSAKALKIFDRVVASGANLFQFTRQVLEYLRRLLIQKVAKKEGDYRLTDIVKVITEISEAEGALRYTQVPQLPIEVAIVQICTEKIDEVKNENDEEDKKKIIPKLAKLPGKIKSSLDHHKKSDIKVESILEKWEEVIEKILPFNHHLSAFFKKAKPIDVKGYTVVLSVPFRFHKLRIESTKAQEAFSKVSADLFGTSLECACEVCQEEDTLDEGVISNNVALEVLGDMME
jgi:DNA polymerase-3 subunit gamma/tau